MGIFRKKIKMTFAGSWKRTKTEGGEAFFKAFDAPEDKLKRAASADLATTVEENEGPLGNKHTFNITRDGAKVVATADIVTMTFEVVNGELVESWTGKGNTFKRFHAKA